MTKFTKPGKRKIGLPPGSLFHIGQIKTEKVNISLFDYNESHFEEKKVKSIEECFPYKGSSTVTWINLDGLHEVEILAKIGAHYGLHPLIIEEILNTDHRPSMKDFEDYIFISLKMLYPDAKSHNTTIEQVSIVLGPSFVISFQEGGQDVFDPVRERIRSGVSSIRKLGTDYLAYSLIDAIVDNYFTVLEKLGENIEDIEDKLITTPSTQSLQTIHRLKTELIFLRKAAWPLREVMGSLEKRESPLIRKTTTVFLRDVYDHIVEVIDSIESFRDMVSGMLDIYLSSVSNRLNAVMKVLTIIATIFMPLTFIAGVYGMNFRYMPELEWPWGYFIILFIMFAIAITMLVYFRKKQWL
jgi:magnesium transporter